MIYNEIDSERRSDKVEFKRFSKAEYLPYDHPGFATAAIHAGQQPEPVHGSINVPVYLSSTFMQRGLNEFTSNYHYTRCGNPTTGALQNCMKQLQYGKYSLAFSSLCGVASALFHLIGKNDHVIVCDNLYISVSRHINRFIKNAFEIEVDFVDMTNINNIRNKIKKNTKLILTESPINPTMVVYDLEAIGKLGKEFGILTAIDNSFASSYLQSPLLLGIDISMISCSKYLGGHCDLIMGVMVTNNQKVYEDLVLVAETEGTTPSAFDSYLVLRSLKTLEVRITRQCQNAYTIAHFLQTHPMIEKVYYVGLKAHPQHELAKKQMRGYGGVILFDLRGEQKQASVLLTSCKVIQIAESFGGVKSLAEYPYATIQNIYQGYIERIGVTKKMIRLAVGIECIEDLIADIDQALRKTEELKE